MFWRKFPRYELVRYVNSDKSYARYNIGRRTIYLDAGKLDSELQITIVYILTHEFLHYWLHENVGRKACIQLDAINDRQHFHTDDEPLIMPILWSGGHKKTLRNLMWTAICINNWRKK